MRSEVEVNLMNVDLCSVSGVGGWKIHIACETKHQRSFPEIVFVPKPKPNCCFTSRLYETLKDDDSV